jgi:diguanylate cyclase (GGDEF)-like protein
MDELTGLSNRRGFLVVSGQALAQCARTQREASLLFFDLDDFKQINDTLGHAEGDRALTEFSSLLLEVFRDSDVVARLGGDEFCVLLTGTSSDDLEHPLQRFADALVARNAASKLRYELNYSVGAVCFNLHRHRTPEDLLRDADAYMYQQKRGKRAAQR